jgi:putative membrane protein
MRGSGSRRRWGRGIAAGAAGGLAGTLAMNYAQRLWTLAMNEPPPASAGGKHDARDWQERREHRNSNELAAQAIARVVVGRRLTRDELAVAAPIVHFGFGAAVGAAYGAWVEARRPARAGSGAGLGATLWITADEIAMPVLGLSEPTTRRPVELHLQSFTAHIVYGVVAEFVRSGLRDSLQRPGKTPSVD